MRLALFVPLLTLVGCAGFKPVARGDWFRVYDDPARRDGPQRLIDRDAYEAEVAEGHRRSWEPPPGWAAPHLEDVSALSLKVGEVKQLVADEQRPVALELNGSAASVWWSEAKKRDEWKNDQAITYVESQLFVRGEQPGTAVLRVQRDGQSRDLTVTVTP